MAVDEQEVNRTIQNIAYGEHGWLLATYHLMNVRTDELKAAYAKAQQEWLDRQDADIERLEGLLPDKAVNAVAVIVGVYDAFHQGARDADHRDLNPGWQTIVCREVRARLGLPEVPYQPPQVAATLVEPESDVPHMVSCFERQGDLPLKDAFTH